MSDYQWYKTDTAGIMYTAIAGKDSGRVYRLAAVLKSGDVDGKILQQAVYALLPRFPYFSVRYKKGFFWGYLEHTDKKPVVRREQEYPAALAWYGKNGGPEFRVLYYKRRISLEISHLITDGTGAVEFLKAIVCEYLSRSDPSFKIPQEIKSVSDKADPCEEENAYARYYSGEKPLDEPSSSPAYQLKLNREEDYVKAVFGLIDFGSLKPRCKQKNLTVTEYLAAAEIFAIIRSAPEAVTDAVKISVPVNLRNFFPSETLRNFATDISVCFEPKGRRDYTFDEICTVLSGVLKQKITKQSMQSFINKTYHVAKNPIIRLVPFFIKKPVLNRAQIKLHRDGISVVLTNLGVVSLPPELAEKIERLDFVGGDPSVYGLTVTSSVISFDNVLNICFSCASRDTSFTREFFRILTEDSVKVRVESSDENGFSRTDSKKAKFCRSCGVELPREYTVCPLCQSKAEKTDREPSVRQDVSEYPPTFRKIPAEKPSGPKGPISAEKLKAFFSF
ncbi:MAG: hypothetical protein ACI4XE_08780 [Acutalibacteraceae bacterium]